VVTTKIRWLPPRLLESAHMKTTRIVLSLLLAGLLAGTIAGQQRRGTPFNVVEASIPDMQKAMKEGRVTSRELVLQYLTRIGIYEDKLHAALFVNPDALKEAEQLDRERAQGKLRGPLHGIPIALKDNIHTTSMPTTGGALAFDGYIPPYEATLTRNLKDSGAIIIAKTGLTELANWVAGAPTPMPGNYNAIGGFGLNPFDPRHDPREATGDGRSALATGGSSSGIGTSANLWAGNVGTDTGGSILQPSNATMLAAIKPTLGRISRWGVIPITADQDTAGPMAKFVTDVAIMLGALEGAKPDPNDPATTICQPPPNRDYTPFLKADGLKGARVGIPRTGFFDRLNGETAKLMADAIAVLKQQGAVVVDPADIPSVADKDQQNNFNSFGICQSPNQSRGKDENCSIVFKYGMKRDFNKWLASLGPTAPVKTLTELRQWNLAHQKAGAIKFGQSLLDLSDEMDVEKDRARYEADRAKDIRLAATHGLQEAIQTNKLDALMFPGANLNGIAAKAGYPVVVVPFGMVPNAPANAPFPPGFDARPGPFGVSFAGLACSEPKVLSVAYSFEQATKRRIPPPSAP
jgi:amidase